MSAAQRALPVDHLTLCAIFAELFRDGEMTVLQGGGEEPVYLPADGASPCHRIVFRHDYPSSALHEVAHWCIAGPARRRLSDYGYWYSPDGRSPARQAEFEVVEVKPQALEWIFSRAIGLPFRPSIDNLDGSPADAAGFARAIQREVHRRCREGLPHRATRFHAALVARSGLSPVLSPDMFNLDATWLGA